MTHAVLTVMAQTFPGTAGSTVRTRLVAELRSGHRLPVALLMSLALAVSGLGLSGTALS